MKYFLIIFSFLLFSIELFCQTKDYNVIGIYKSEKNNFEKWSIMNLKSDYNFIYEYGIGGCQGIITGKWRIENKRIKFINDNQFINNENNKPNEENKESSEIDNLTPYYPDLSLIDWKFNGKIIKPISPIDCGCLIVKEKHKKKN